MKKIKASQIIKEYVSSLPSTEPDVEYLLSSEVEKEFNQLKARIKELEYYEFLFKDCDILYWDDLLEIK